MGNSNQIRSEAMSAETELLENLAYGGEHILAEYMLLLYKGLLGSVLDYALVCYFGMAKTHMLRM
jgi:hypothetical protein